MLIVKSEVKKLAGKQVSKEFLEELHTHVRLLIENAVAKSGSRKRLMSRDL